MIDMKLGPVTKHNKKKHGNIIKNDDDVMSANCDVLSLFRFMVNLEQFGTWIPDAWSVNLTFSYYYYHYFFL